MRLDGLSEKSFLLPRGKTFILLSMKFFGHGLAAFGVCLAIVSCERLPTEPAESNPTQIHGVTFADWTANGYSNASADRGLDAIAVIGATHLVIIATAYQADPQANEMRSVNALTGARTPTSPAVRHALERALSLGMKVAIKPHVDLDDGSWRGRIVPSDPNTWFKSYQDFILPWVELASPSAQLNSWLELNWPARFNKRISGAKPLIAFALFFRAN